jgi:hypothetical protein
MKDILIFMLVLHAIATSAQVGIGTSNPEENLHIVGPSTTIRIEGLNSINNTKNDGINLAPVYVDGLGNYTLTPQFLEPIVFLAEDENFIPDNPNGLSFKSGTIINNDQTQTLVEAVVGTKAFNLPQPAIIEVNYAVTMLLSATNLSSNSVSGITDGKARTGEVYFMVDINSDGLDTTESSKKYGLQGIYYASSMDGVAGYAYVNSQGYVSLPEGNHTLYFYGVVKDGINTFTSMGFGGSKDYLKIRLYY